MSAPRALATVLAAPDEDAPRRALADALRQQGEPDDLACAELIDVQLELARLPRWHPSVPDLRRSRQRLLDAHADRWREALGCSSLWLRFERGLAARAEGSPAELCRELPDLVARAPIRAIELSLDEDDPGLDAALAKLAELDALRGIRELSASDASSRPAPFAALLASPTWDRMEALHLGPDLCVEPIAAALGAGEAPPRLTRLWCEGFLRGFGDAGLAALARAPWFARLTDLRLRAQELTDDGLGALVRDLALEHLDLSNVAYSENRVGPDGLRALVEAPWFAGLASLSLSGLKAAGAAVPRVLARATGLRAANLSSTGVDAEQLVFIAEMPVWTRLDELSLSGNAIGDDGAEALARARRLPAVLALQDCGIGPEGLAHLADAPEVAALDLRCNDLGADDWAAALRADRLPRATALMTDARGWPDDLAAALRARYPRCDLDGAP